jgi:hypothetical protein
MARGFDRIIQIMTLAVRQRERERERDEKKAVEKASRAHIITAESPES